MDQQTTRCGYKNFKKPRDKLILGMRLVMTREAFLREECQKKNNRPGRRRTENKENERDLSVIKRDRRGMYGANEQINDVIVIPQGRGQHCTGRKKKETNNNEENRVKTLGVYILHEDAQLWIKRAVNVAHKMI